MASIVVFSSFSAKAQENPQPTDLGISITQPDAAKLKFMVIVGNPGRKKVELRVTNSNYGTIDRMVFHKTQYGMVCNLTDAPDGIYMIEVRSGKEKIKRPIAINTVSLQQTSRMASYAAVDH